MALKIYAASVDASNELSILRHLRATSQGDSNSKFALLPIDYFELQGPNGHHFCFVTEPMGPSITTVLNAPFDDFDPINPPTRRFSTTRNKRILKRILCGLKFLHGNNIVHGDLQLGNVLFPPKDLTICSPSELEQKKDTSQLDLLESKDGEIDSWSPKYLVVPEPLENSDVPQGQADDVKLIDLGGNMSHAATILYALQLTDSKPFMRTLLPRPSPLRWLSEHRRSSYKAILAQPSTSGASGASCSSSSLTASYLNYSRSLARGTWSMMTTCSSSQKPLGRCR
jgi:serine/threonine protein kinase